MYYDFEKSNSHSFILISFILGLILLLAFRDINGIKINNYVYLIYIVIFMFLAKYKTLVYMVIFMFPLFWGLPGTYIILAAIILSLIKYKLINKNVLWLMFIFVAQEFMAMLFYSEIFYAVEIKYLCTLMIFFSFLYLEEKIDYNKAVLVYFIGSSVLCVIIIISTLATAPDNWIDLFAKGWFRFGNVQASETEGMTLQVNANTLAYYSIVGISIGIVLLQKYNSILMRILIGIMMFWHFLAGIFSMSRTWIISIILIVVLLIFDSVKNGENFLSMILILLVIACIVSFLFNNNSAFLQGFLTRLTDSTMSSGGGRIGILTLYWKQFFDNVRFIFLGTGVTQYREVLGSNIAMHNAIQQIVVCYGIPGSIVFFIGMLTPVFKISKKPFIYWIPVIMTIVFIQTIQFVNPDTLMLPYIIAIFVLKADTMENKDAGKI